MYPTTTSCLLLLLSIGLMSTTKVPVYVGALFKGGSHWFAPYALALEKLFDLAFEEISNRTDILPDYELKLITKFTEVSPGYSAKKMFELINEEPTKIALLGPLFSDELVLVGEITPFYNLLQMSFVAGTSTIKDRRRFPSLYSTVFIQDDLNPLRIRMMKYFGWTRVATILFDMDYFGSQIDEFHSLLQTENFTLLTSSVIVDLSRTEEHIKRLKQYHSRVIFGAFRSTQAPAIFCEAYKQGMYGSKYVWILSGTSMYTFWTDSRLDGTGTRCTREQILEAARGYITLDHESMGEADQQTISGRSVAEYDQYIRTYLAQFPTYKISRKYTFAYDTAWAIALALNASLCCLNGSTLTDFNYNNSEMLSNIKDKMDRIHFQGVSGPVSFQNGRRIGFSYIQSNEGFDRSSVAKFDPTDQSLNWTFNPSLLFQGGKVPKDSFTYTTKYFTIPMSAMVCMLILDTIGFLMAVGFLTFNIYFRENRNIKMSSPRVNNVIIIGAFIMYASVCVSTYSAYNAPNVGRVTCMVDTWVHSIGFTTVFGALFSKTWRVHVLFKQSTVKRKAIKDSQLFGQLFLLIILDLILLTAWTVFHPLEQEQIKINRQASDDDVVLSEVFTQCNHRYLVYWAAAEYVYKGLLLVFGTFLAWETRDIHVPVLNDSIYIGFCVYNIVVVCAIGVPTHHILTVEQSLIKYILSNALTIFCTSLVLCILFIPKISLRNQTENIRFVPTLKGMSAAESSSTNRVTQLTTLQGNWMSFDSTKDTTIVKNMTINPEVAEIKVKEKQNISTVKLETCSSGLATQCESTTPISADRHRLRGRRCSAK
ncbi:gamma-aminobutyric acid type B receptor subunit 2-like [Ylistrum balloti]|uniref:gamma-aminobutyric acid type B receptor subunit 2-like n=1 Tax=Ylistrum balloti TaxID=509963 RepID=UPI002905E976|nr:gamma-aminobutyric acid type B receptor subunit 2-like [Ylistrum balloti]